MHTQTHARTHTYTHSHTDTHSHTETQTHKHIQTKPDSLPLSSHVAVSPHTDTLSLYNKKMYAQNIYPAQGNVYQCQKVKQPEEARCVKYCKFIILKSDFWKLWMNWEIIGLVDNCFCGYTIHFPAVYLYSFQGACWLQAGVWNCIANSLVCLCFASSLPTLQTNHTKLLISRHSLHVFHVCMSSECVLYA